GRRRRGIVSFSDLNKIMIKGWVGAQVDDAVAEQRLEAAVVLTPPLALEGGLAEEHQTPGLLPRVLSLLRNLPPIFNMPKSQLQCYGESVYCINEDYLTRCPRGKSSFERFTSVVAWSISTMRPAIFGLAPFDPLLGETHHVSRGSLNVLLEQVTAMP
ncbi:hypothetical protein GW17_00043564, partial [Ensete ventricosum]